MKRQPKRWGRVLAIDPTHRGFGFAILEESGRLVDWGVKDLDGKKSGAWLLAVRELTERYLPDAIVVEDCAAAESRRGRRARAFTLKALALAKALKLGRCRVRQRAVRLACAGAKEATKEQVALALAGLFPELVPRLPPHRKPWMSEDYRMSIFDAVALGVASFSKSTG
jgi:Holliday junction resolvasome RuvABC endonuclease subunit